MRSSASKTLLPFYPARHRASVLPESKTKGPAFLQALDVYGSYAWTRTTDISIMNAAL